VAFALLRDLAGDIRLSIPVSIDPEGRAETGLTSIVAAAFRQALFGALSSPFKLMGAVLPDLGRGGLSLAPLPSVPGEPSLTDDALVPLASLAEILEARPQVGLVLRGRVGEEDRPFLARRELLARWEVGVEWPEVEGASFFARRRIHGALEARERGEAGILDPEDEAILAGLVAALEIPPERVHELAVARATWTRGVLERDHGTDPARVEVRDAPDEGDPGVLIGFTAVD
jgi:hypothetical protein